MNYKNLLLITATAFLAMGCKNGNTAKVEEKTDSAVVAPTDTIAPAAPADTVTATPAEETAEAKETPSFAGSFYEVLSSEDETPCVLEIDYNAKTKKATGQWIVPKGFGEDVFPQIAEVQGKLVNGIIKLGGEAGLAEYELDVVYIDENTITINGNKYTQK